jgi:hypothetical protein
MLAALALSSSLFFLGPSHHYGQEDGYTYALNNKTGGVFYANQSGLTLGAYNNSLSRLSLAAGYTWQAYSGKHVQLDFVAGAATGYVWKVSPLALARVCTHGLCVAASPKTGPLALGAVSIGYKLEF